MGALVSKRCCVRRTFGPREQLGAILTWEWQGPTLMAQHFLTVASYNMQHPARLVEEKLAMLQEIFN